MKKRSLVVILLFTICTGNVYSQFIPSDISGLAVWLRADTGVTFSTPPNVQQLLDASGLNNDAVQMITTNQPTLVNAVPLLNYHSVLRLDGADDFLEIADDASIDFSGQLSIFILIKQEILIDTKTVLSKWDYGPQGSWGIITCPGFADEMRVFVADALTDGGNNHITTGDYNNTTTFSVMALVYDGSQAASANRVKMYKNGAAISSVESGGVISASLQNATATLKIGSFGNLGWYFNGDLGEIVMYNGALTDPERIAVQTYFREKYAPPVNLGPDIVSTDLCADTLDASARFVSYLWSTGDTTQTIQVTGSGTYTVSVTDVFGFTSSDTIDVTFPSFNEPPLNAMVCLNDSILWNTNLSSSSFTFLWSTGETTPSIYIDSAGQYWVTITDAFSCSRTSDTITVAVDSFPVIATLGPDVSLCSGNTIQLVAAAAQAQSYLWSDSSTAASLVVLNTDTYWVSVTDTNGCVARDSIVITIVGVAPFVNFSAPAVCEGDTMFFTDSSDTTVVAWSWNFGEPSSGPNNFSSLQNPYHVYDSSGTYQVTLIDTTSVGCYNDTTISVIVNPNPVPIFIHGTPCTGAPLLFTNNTDTVGVTSWQWNFGDPGSGGNNVSSLKNPNHTFNTSGNFFVTLTVTLSNGCSATDTVVVNVGQAIIPTFSFFNTCIGQVTNFFTSVSGASLQWNFGDNSFSTQQNPQHQYAFVQTYQCTLTAVTMAGCTNSTYMDVAIHDLPVAHFSTPPACLNVPYQMLDSSYISAGTITQWLWGFPDFTTSAQQNPFHTFNDTLQYNVTLRVISNQGCVDTVTRAVKVHPLPTASFISDVTYGDAPLIVDFSNQSAGAASYMWDFGDTAGTSALADPTYTFTELGTYPVTLVTSTSFGCTDTMVKFIFVLEPFLDLAVTGINKTSGANTISLSAGIANLGNIAVTDFKISAWLENSLPVFETWNGDLPPQSTLQPPYSFAASFEVPQINPPDILCVEITEVNGSQDDNPANNIRCINLVEDFVVVEPYPNPSEQVINLQVVVARRELLNIAVYDAAGKLITEVFNGQAAPGLNKFVFDISSLAEGTYFCKYSFSEKTIVKPLTHISKKKK